MPSLIHPETTENKEDCLSVQTADILMRKIEACQQMLKLDMSRSQREPIFECRS